MSTARARLRVVVVGCGDIASTAHLPALQRSLTAELVAVVDSDEGRRGRAATDYGVPGYADLRAAMQAAPEAAIVCTPPDVTPAVCEKGIGYGLHLLCEKPMATDVARARGLHTLAATSGLIVQVGFTNRFSPLVDTLHDAIAGGRLGAPLVYTLAAYDERYDATDRHHLGRMTRFLERAPSFVHEGAHLTDYVAFLNGSRPTRVSAAGLRTAAEFPSENFVAATVEWANGDLARLEVGWLFPALPDGHFRVLGPRASAEIFRSDGRLVFDDGRERDDHSLRGNWTEVSFERQLAHFVASVRGEASPGPTTADGLASLELSDAIVRSMREGRVVEIGSPDAPSRVGATVDAGRS
jgi:predicted dehydrogenase